MTVVGAEHDAVGMLVEQRYQGLIILGRRPFAYLHHHACLDASPRLFQRGALVVGADARLRILLPLLSMKPRGMSVYRFAACQGRLYLGQRLGIIGQHSGIIHHLSQKTDVVTVHQLADVAAVQACAACLDVGTARRHTRRGTETEVEADMPPVGYHEVDALIAKHVADFVRVGNDTYRPLLHRHTGKFGRHHHTALDVHMTVDEARHPIGSVAGYVVPWCDAGYHAVVDLHLAVKHLTPDDINDMSCIFHAAE